MSRLFNTGFGSRTGLFKTKAPKQFEIYPRYWDPDKEDLDKRVERARKEAGIRADGSIDETIARRERIRKNMHEEWTRDQYSRGAMMANIRLIIIIAVLIFVVAYVFNFLDSSLFEEMFNSFTKK